MHKSLVIVCMFLLGCGAAEEPSKAFVGHWVYQIGSMATRTCPNEPPLVADLGSSVPPSGQPAAFTLSRTSATHVHELDEVQCEYDWAIDGDVASIGPPGQPCSHFPDGMGGMVSGIVSAGHKSTYDGKTMTIHIEATIGGVCSQVVDGTAIKMP